MFSRNLLLGAVMGAVCLAASALPASAAIISQTKSIALSLTDWTNTTSLDFAKFDSSLGTLTKVFVGLDSYTTSTILFESLDASPSMMSASVSGLIKIDRPDLTNILTQTPGVAIGPIGLAAFDGSMDFAGASGTTIFTPLSLSSSMYMAPPGPLSDLALFTGLGNIILPASAKATSLITGPGNNIGGVLSLAGADVTVKYYYTPNAVPEPGTLSLLGSGLIGLSAFARRRKAKAAK